MSDNVKIYDPKSTQLTIQLTPAAMDYFKKEVTKNSALGLRLGVKKAGCSGYKYVVDFAKALEEYDQKFLQANGLEVFIDHESLPALAGMTIDYVKEGLNSKVKFINPNEVASCGCGESFSVDPKKAES